MTIMTVYYCLLNVVKPCPVPFKSCLASLCILLSFKERKEENVFFQNFSVKSFDKIQSDSTFSFRIKCLSLYRWSVYICVCAQCACLVPTGSNVNIWPRELKVSMEFISLNSIYLSWQVWSIWKAEFYHANQWNFFSLDFTLASG